MKITKLFYLTLLASATAIGWAQNAANPASITAAASEDPVLTEVSLMVQAHQAARIDDDDTVDAALFTASRSADSTASSVLLARRAVAVCGWLQNDNEYERAAKLARRVLARLNDLTETDDKSREDRLYWEALLEGRMLDHLQRAIDLLDAALAISPDDERVLDLKLQFCSAAAARVH